MMRKLFRNIHLWLSLPLGLIISVICLSGASLVFERDITQAEPLASSELEAAVRTWAADSLTLNTVRLQDSPRKAALATFRETGKRQLCVDPYTGEVKGWAKSYEFFRTMRQLHRWLLDPPASKGEKSVGKVIVGVTTLTMTLILISGLIIWIPKNRKALKNRLSTAKPPTPCSGTWHPKPPDGYSIPCTPAAGEAWSLKSSTSSPPSSEVFSR